MSGATRENEVREPGEQDSQCSPRRYTIWYYGILLSGSLLMVGGIAGSRLFRLSRSSGWSLFCFTSSVTGMYLSLFSIQRLYNSSRGSISEEAKNSETPVPEKLDISNENNLLHVTECTESITAEDNVIENAIGDSVDEIIEVLSSVVTNVDVNFEENDIEDSTDQHGSNVLKCEGSKNVLPEVDDCKIPRDLAAEDIKDAEVVENEVSDDDSNKEVIAQHINVNDSVSETDILYADVKGYEIEVMTVKDIPFKTTVDNVGASGAIKNKDANESFEKDMKTSKHEDNSSKESNINFPVAADCLTEDKCNNETSIFLKDYNIKELSMEKIIATDINIPDNVAADNLITEILENDHMANEVIEEDFITQEAKIRKFIVEKDKYVINVMSEDDLIESKFDINAMTILDVVKEAKISEKYNIVDDSLTDDVNKSKPSGESKIKEFNVINESEKKEVTENYIHQSNINVIGMEEVKIRETIITDVNKEFLVAKDCITEGRIDEIESKHESLEDPLAKNDENKHISNNEVQENVLDKENVTEEEIEKVTAEDIFRTPLAHDNVSYMNSIKKMDGNEPHEMMFKMPKNEEVTSIHLGVGNLLHEKNDNQKKCALQSCKNEIEECNFKESEIEIISISKDTSMEDHSFGHVIEDKLNKDDFKMEILQENIKKVPKNTIDALVDNVVCERGLAVNIVENTSIEEVNIIQDSDAKSGATKCISIEDNLVKGIVEETFFKSLTEELEEDHSFGTEDEINTKTVDNEISECDIDDPRIVVDKTTLIKSIEIQNEHTVEVTTDEHMNEGLGTEFNATMSLTEQFPKLAESSTVQHINQLLSDSTDELRFISPNTASGIGVFFRKSNKARLAAQFTNTSTVPVEDCNESKPSISQQTETLVRNEYSSNTNTVITNVSIQSSEICTSFKDVIAWKPSSNTIDASTEKASNFSDSRKISPTSESLNFSDSNVESANSKYCIGLATDTNVLNTDINQSTETLSSSIDFHKNQTCDADLPTVQSSGYLKSVVASISELPRTDKGVLVLSSLPNDVRQDIIHSIQSPTFLDIAGISPTKRHLRLPDISSKDASPVISDEAVSIPIKSQNPSSNISATPGGHLPKPFDGSSAKSRQQSPKTSDTKFPSFSGHSPRSPTDKVFLHDRHSPKFCDVENSFRHTLRSSVGGIGHIRRASWSSTVSQSRRSFGRGISPCSEPPTGVSENDVFSRAADSPWISCDDISQAGHASKRWGRDVFSLARNSPWSSCGDVSSQARHSKRTNDGDVFSDAHHSPWVSGSGTIFHADHYRKSRSSSHPRRSRLASGGSGVPRVRHSLSPTKCVALPTEKSPTRNFTSPSGQPRASYDASPTRQSIDPVSSASLTVQSNSAFVDTVSSHRHSPNAPSHRMSE